MQTTSAVFLQAGPVGVSGGNIVSCIGLGHSRMMSQSWRVWDGDQGSANNYGTADDWGIQRETCDISIEHNIEFFGCKNSHHF